VENDGIKNLQDIKIKALDNKNGEKGHIKARTKENGKVFIVWTETDPQGQGTGSLLYKALESIFPSGTIIHFKEIANNSQKARDFWAKMGFLLKPFDGEQKAEYYWKIVP
jgi:DNA replication protein DnaD